MDYNTNFKSKINKLLVIFFKKFKEKNAKKKKSDTKVKKTIAISVAEV